MKDTYAVAMHVRHVTAIHPSVGKALRSVAGRFTPVVAALVLIQFWLAGPSSPRDKAFDYIVLVIALTIVVADWIYRISTVLQLTDDALIVQTMLVRRLAIPRERIRGIALRSIYTYPWSRSYAIVYGDRGTKIVALPEGIWEDADIHRLQAAFGSRDHWYQQVTSKEFRREFGNDFFSPYIGWIIALVMLVFIFIAASSR
jgi:hypothetical protein